MEGNILAALREGPDVQTSWALAANLHPVPFSKAAAICVPQQAALQSPAHTAESLTPPPGVHAECLYLSCPMALSNFMYSTLCTFYLNNNKEGRKCV